MNTVLLNTISLDEGRIIKKGSGGGGGGNTPGGGGGGSDMPVIGDGKTYLYIKIAEKGRMNVSLSFTQTKLYGVTIDWGDGSPTQTSSYIGNNKVTHTYADVGEYVISLNPADGCTLGVGPNASKTCVMGSTAENNSVYRSMLKYVEIGKNVTSIGNYAFGGCYSLSSVVIPEGVTSIGEYAFQYCYSLSSVVIPEGVTSIGEYAFQYCYSLSSVVIPEGVTSIGEYAFQYCYSLSSVVIPEGVTSIGEYAFQYCYSLSSVVIPEGVTSIGYSAFQYCQSLASVVIPKGVTSIGSNAFSGCKSMAFYDFSQCISVPTLGGTSVFSGIPSDCKIVVPDALYDEWIAATNWSSHASMIIKASEFNA